MSAYAGRNPISKIHVYGLDCLCTVIFILEHFVHDRFTPLAQSRRMFFLTFPVLVLGSSATTSTSRGIMNLLISLAFRAHSITSEPVKNFPGFTVTNAFGRSPQWLSGTATTPASRMSGWVTSIDSSATDEIFSPPASRLLARENTTVCYSSSGLTADNDVFRPVLDLD